VILSYRGEAFARAKPRNRERIAAAEKAGSLQVMLESSVLRIEPAKVFINHKGRDLELPNDVVIVSAGGVLPSEFLKKTGVDVETKYGTA